ncbi:MAG: hypothetical protein ABF792_00795 [Bifidobacterium psychraerophilum]|uniref:hypothetical protein n=1 Tax=Bifidobacterium psychraerophilum TaxID=218140 RepID=UPI0039ECBEB5
MPTRDLSVIPRRTVLRAVLTVMVSALLTGGLFSLFYIAVFNAPEPHELPIALAGIPAGSMQKTAGDEYKLIQVGDQAAGLSRLNRHDVYGVIALDATHRTVRLSYTSVDGSSVLAYMQPLAKRIAEHSGMALSVRNTTPEVASNATPGRSVFFAVFGTALTGFVLSQALSSLAKVLRLSLRARLGIMLMVSVIAGLFVALLLDPWYGIAPGTFWSALPMLALLCMSAVTTGTALLEAVGPLGQVHHGGSVHHAGQCDGHGDIAHAVPVACISGDQPHVADRQRGESGIVRILFRGCRTVGRLPGPIHLGCRGCTRAGGAQPEKGRSSNIGMTSGVMRLASG